MLKQQLQNITKSNSTTYYPQSMSVSDSSTTPNKSSITSCGSFSSFRPSPFLRLFPEQRTTSGSLIANPDSLLSNQANCTPPQYQWGEMNDEEEEPPGSFRKQSNNHGSPFPSIPVSFHYILALNYVAFNPQVSCFL